MSEENSGGPDGVDEQHARLFLEQATKKREVYQATTIKQKQNIDDVKTKLADDTNLSATEVESLMEIEKAKMIAEINAAADASGAR